MSEKSKTIVEKINANFAKGNFEEFLSACADDMQWTIVGEPTLKGKETIRQWLTSMAATNPEPPKLTVDNVFAEGDFVAAYGDMTMKDKDGKLGSYSYCDIYRFRGDKIVEETSYVVNREPKAEASSGHR